MIDDVGKTILPPYISYQSFKNLLTHLEASVPPRLDRSVWGKHYSGSTGLQLLAALRFLGLIEGQANLVTPLLEQLVEERESRKQLLAKILHERYAPVFDTVLDLSKATPAMLEEAFRKLYGIREDTLRKAISFFIHAAQDAEIPISGRITEKTRTRSVPARSVMRTNGKKSRPTSSAISHPETVPTPPRQSPTSSQQARPAISSHQGSPVNEETILLPHGGTVTLNLSVNWIKVDEREREALLNLIDAFNTLPQATSEENDFVDEEEMTEEEELV